MTEKEQKYLLDTWAVVIKHLPKLKQEIEALLGK